MLGSDDVPHSAAVSGRLPAELTSFVGRRRELADARQLLSTSRLLTMTGPGGVGKTRLALRVAAGVRRAFPDGVWLVELAELGDPALLPRTVAVTLGMRDASAEPMEMLAEFLEDKRLLLVLDNCEHLVDACAVMAGKLLATAAGLRILATSRHVLGVEGEQILAVPPLPSAEDGAGTMGSEAILADSSVLFAERAAAVVPGFAVNGHNRDVVARICRRLDGIPLAIELAAVRLPSLGLNEILDRLDDRFRLLSLGSRALLPRQRTLSAAVNWSYDLCSPQEQLLWARLAVFPGGFDLVGAEEVGAGGGLVREEVFGLLAGLVDKSIVVRVDDTNGQWSRYRMLETIREYGLARLTESGGEDAVRERHQDHYQRLAQRYAEEHFGPRQLEWIQHLLNEHPNLRAALEYGLTRPPRAPVAMRTAAALWDYWFSRGMLREGYDWLRRALACDPEPNRARAEALWTCSFLGIHLGEFDHAEEMSAEAHALARRLDDDALTAALALCGGLRGLHTGNVLDGRDQLRKAVDRYRESGDGLGLANSLILLAGATFFLDDPAGATVAAECLELCETRGAIRTKCYALWAVATHRWRAGEHREAAVTIREAIWLQRRVHDWTGLAHYLEVLSWCTESAGEHERAARLLGATSTVWRLSGARTFEAPPYQAVDEQAAASARQALGEERFRSAFQEGAEFTVHEAIDYAVSDNAVSDNAGADYVVGEASGGARVDDEDLGQVAGLTPREIEVAELVKQGMTNREIADRLVVSPRTVETHVEHVLAKLGLTSRTRAAAWLTQRQDLR